MIATLPLLYSLCFLVVIVLCLFLAVPWFGLQCVIVVFPGHTHLLLLRPGMLCKPRSNKKVI